MHKFAAAFFSSLCSAGLLLGTLFFAASLTPSLVPRVPLLQGVLSGLCFAAGYGIGCVLRSGWRYLGWPEIHGRLRTTLLGLMLTLSVVLIALSLGWALAWQNRLRKLMQMPEIDGLGVFTVVFAAVGIFILVLLLIRLFRRLRGFLAAKLNQRRLPPTTAMVLAIGLTAGIFWLIGNGLLVRTGMHFFDKTYSELDARLEAETPRPSDHLKTGSSSSLIDWSTLGRQGRRMVAGVPDRQQITAITGHAAQEPLRVYVGLGSAETPQQRADLALAELKRIGAFDRANLVIATPTGTGWVDQEGQQALEYLLLGDVATVSVQYSYLASWLALLTNPDYGVETARVVFSTLYEHWRQLPKDKRPRLYLQGLSLGALNASLSHDLHQVIGDPYQGMLLAGTPFNTPLLRHMTSNRNPESPAWLPRVRDGSVLRFTTQHNHLNDQHAPWGPFRTVFLQYASDAVTYFDPQALWRRPEWMNASVGPDVSPDMFWLPVVTFLQLGIDIMVAVAPPMGYGHVYAFEHYVDAWASLVEPSEFWSAEKISLLKARVQLQRAGAVESAQ